HPRWRAEGADGPYLVSPALMMVVPRRTDVRLYYARTAADGAGMALTGLAGAIGMGALLRRRRRGAPPAEAGGGAVLSRLAAARSEAGAPQPLDACDLPAPPRRWGGVIPAALLVLLPLGRLAPGPPPVDTSALHEKASRAYAEGRFADAAEYARHALGPSRGSSLHAELLALRAEALLRAGPAPSAAEAFEALLSEPAGGAYTAQALFGAAQARAAAGDGTEAARHRDRLLREFAHTPWAERARKEGP
ncbi:MAG TPA: hypothetical protein VFO85_03700, partial [Vicinamibacteria bacterium]|nr:hypothetical protein [Vicinamibacteria bacterium]